ncbi:ladderlectin-like protein, partial [Leptotrombidium deliense]
MASVMVSIHSKEENNFLASITNHGFYWLGGRRDTTPNAKTRWDDGTPFNFENWRREHFRESELFNFIQFQKGFWIYFRNDRVSQLCQKQLADDSQQSPNSSSLSSSVSSSNQKSDQMKTDLNKLKENVDSRLKILSEQLSKVAIKEEATTKKCKEGWTQWKNKCYQLIRSTDNFNSQKSRCKSMNASIVAIRSQEENDFITANFNRITAWLGAQREVGHRWKWHDGTDLIYTNWNEGEPNNLEGEDCIQYYNNIGHAGYWNDYPCTRHESVICEITLKGNEEEVTTKIPFEDENIGQQDKETKVTEVNLFGLMERNGFIEIG